MTAAPTGRDGPPDYDPAERRPYRPVEPIPQCPDAAPDLPCAVRAGGQHGPAHLGRLHIARTMRRTA
ncbi:hypothetical protein Val02_52350 [Virgisporangium aliadipatigenens]|uniref:Uncharacterized protein n=1 Tax=Virgisporangium aliadipatigenens TaxID=741659 RepID=A0A8J3YMP8_9ACTN|nr:hypothetical protein Val02_52350 [Virgisporangium aliadipatigenens]